MARARTKPVHEASNVVVLRPGFALPKAPEPVADPLKKRGAKRLGRPPKHLQRDTTNAQDLQCDATATFGKKPSVSNDLQHATSLIHYKADPVASCPVANSALLPKREFMRLVHDLPAMKLRERFRSEEVAYRAMLQRRSKGAIIHPEFADFRSFLIHVGQRPNSLWTLDRIDVANPMYGPGLVEWSDPRQQANNRNRTIFLKVRGRIMPLTEWARMTGQKPDTLRRRLKLGMSHEEVVYGRGKGPAEPLEMAAEMPSLADADTWPTGIQPADWEPAFKAYRAQFNGRVIPGLTRAVIFAWIGGNRLRLTKARLRDRHPGYDDPEASEPASVRTDPDYVDVVAYEGPVAEALRMVWADPIQDDLYRNLRHQWSGITDPALVGKRARHYAK